MICGRTLLMNFHRLNRARMKKYENVIISALSIALFFTLYLPSLKDYHLAENNFKKIFVDHKIYQWDFPTAKFKSTMNPAYFYNAVSLIKKYSSGTDSIYMVSKYDTILPFLAGKYSVKKSAMLNALIITFSYFFIRATASIMIFNIITAIKSIGEAMA